MDQSLNSANSENVSGTDFKEDPFQNYRYAELDSISDPFQDEDPPAVPAKGKTKDSLTKFVALIDFPSTEEKFEVKAENLFDKFSFNDADPFTADEFVKKSNGNDGNNNFDPFGAPLTNNSKNSKKETTEFGFDADFANFDAFNDAGTTNGNGTKVDAWGGSLDKKNNNNLSLSSTKGRVKKYKEADVSKINKFSADYSDNFDNDLEQALKRSVMDQ